MENFIANNKRIFQSYHGKQWSPSLSGYFVKPKLTDETCHLVEKRKNKVSFPVNLAYSDLFEDKKERKAGKNVVVISEEGVGKTTLCMSVYSDWACDKLFCQFELLIYLPLHHKKLFAAASLCDLLRLLYPREKKETCASLASYIDESRGKNVLIIADGWEKLGDSQGQNGSFLSEMLFGRRYPDMSVLLTVHSSSLALMPGVKCIDQLVRIHGFSNKHIEQYIKHELTDMNAVSRLLAQLQSNPLLEMVCSIPVICATICHLWHAHQEDLPTTLTELYTKVVLHIVADNLRCKCLRGFLEIPEKLKQSWKILCVFAFQSLEDNHSAFSNVEIASYFQTDLEKIQRFGLLRLSQSFFDVEHFQFLHQHFQRYLAAQHLVNLSSKMQLKVFRKHAGKDSFNLVWKFFFGLSFTTCSLDVSSTIVKNAVQILYKSSNDRLQLCHCAFEAGNVEVTHEVIKAVMSNSGSRTNIISHFGELHTPYDSTAVINVIANIQKCTAVEVNFSNCSLSDKQFREFECALLNVQLTGLDLSNNNLEDSIVSRLFDKAPHAFHHLKKLYVRKNCIENEGINAMLKALKQSPSPTLTHLDISYNPLTKGGLERLKHGVSSGVLASLEVLFMRQCLTKSAECNINFLSAFAECLSLNCHSLQRADLFGNDLGEPSSPALSQIISCLTGLRKDFDLYLNREYMSKVNDTFISVMEKSLREKGTIDHTVVHGMIVGPGRSGKDSLMKRLIKKDPPDPNTPSPSTGVLESVVKVEVKKRSTVAVADNYVSWRTLRHDEEAIELMMSTAKSHSEIDIDDITFDECEWESTSDIMEKVPYDTSNVKNMDETSQGTDLEHTDKEMSYRIVSTETLDAHKSDLDHDSIVAESPVDLLKRAVKLKSMDALRDHLESSWTLYLTNTGGQLEYQELLPVLVCGPLAFFITFPLNVDLNKHYTVRHLDENGTEDEYESPSTMIDEILQILSTVSALKQKQTKELKPKVFFVGTHKDKLPSPEADQIINNIDQQLQKQVRSTSLFDQDSIEFASHPDKLIFTVNNLAVDDVDFQKIRLALQLCVERKNAFKIKNCPSSWLIFSLILRAQHKSKQVLTYGECFTIAKRCGISDRIEFNHALFFIHTRLGVVRYYSVKELNTLVVIDPQVLFDGITTFIKKTFVKEHAEPTEIEDFQKKGIFSLKVMKRISQKCPHCSVLPFKWLVKLLIYLKIAVLYTDKNGEEKCFFPSSLPHIKNPNLLTKMTLSLSSPPPMLISFRSGFCPRGIPGALLVELMSKEEQPGVFWHLHRRRIYKNQVSFGVGAGDVTFKIFPTHIEIAFDSESGTSKLVEIRDTCREMFEQVTKAMKEVTANYNERGARYFFAFYCTHPMCKRHPHPAEIDCHMNKLICTVTERRIEFPALYYVWMNEKIALKGDIANQLLTANHLGQIAGFMDEWQGRVSDELGLTKANVAAIKLAYPFKLELQARRALEMWMERLGRDATFCNLINVFNCAARCDFAMGVEDIIDSISSATTESDCKSNLQDPSPLPSPSHEVPVFPAPTKCIVIQDCQSLVHLSKQEVLTSCNQVFASDINGRKIRYGNTMSVPLSHFSTHSDILRMETGSDGEDVNETRTADEGELNLNSTEETPTADSKFKKDFDMQDVCVDGQDCVLVTTCIDPKSGAATGADCMPETANSKIENCDESPADEHVMLLEEKRAKANIIEDIFRSYITAMTDQLNPEIAARCLYEFTIITHDDYEAAMVDSIQRTKRSSALLMLLIQKLRWNPQWCKKVFVALKEAGVNVESLTKDLTDAGIDLGQEAEETATPDQHKHDQRGLLSLEHQPLHDEQDDQKDQLDDSDQPKPKFAIGDEDGNTPLHLATYKGDEALTKQIPKQKFAIGDEYGNTPLHLAVCKGDEALTMQILHDYPGIINIRNKKGETALHLSIKKGFPAVAAILTKSKNCDVLFDKGGWTALHHASASGDPELVIPVLKLPHKSRFIDATDRDGNTAIHLATRGGFIKVMKLLRRNKANSKIENYNQQTPIDIAKETKNEKAYRVLIKWKYAHKFHKPRTVPDVLDSSSRPVKLKRSSTFTNGAMSTDPSTASINSQALSSTCSEFVIESGGIVVKANESN